MERMEIYRLLLVKRGSEVIGAGIAVQPEWSILVNQCVPIMEGLESVGLRVQRVEECELRFPLLE